MPNLFAYLSAAPAGGITNVKVGAHLELFSDRQHAALTPVVILLTGLLMAAMALVVLSTVAGVPLPEWTARRQLELRNFIDELVHLRSNPPALAGS